MTSHYAMFLACEDKLFLAPLDDEKVHVCQQCFTDICRPVLT